LTKVGGAKKRIHMPDWYFLELKNLFEEEYKYWEALFCRPAKYE
jgi:hypothetical protein